MQIYLIFSIKKRELYNQHLGDCSAGIDHQNDWVDYA